VREIGDERGDLNHKDTKAQRVEHCKSSSGFAFRDLLFRISSCPLWLCGSRLLLPGLRSALRHRVRARFLPGRTILFLASQPPVVGKSPLFQEILSRPAGKESIFPAGKLFPPVKH
jgi:hypothetical protein